MCKANFRLSIADRMCRSVVWLRDGTVHLAFGRPDSFPPPCIPFVPISVRTVIA